MELTDKEFWTWLRQTHADATHATAAELAAAERELAELDAGAAEPFTEAQIDALVQAATRAQMTDVVVDRGGPTPWWVRTQRAVAAAAALMLAPKFILAMTAVAAVTVTTIVGIQYSTLTLPYQEAIEILTDFDRPEDDRRSAQVRIGMDLVDSAGLLREVALDDSRLGREAERTLVELRMAIAVPEPFTPTEFSDMHADLGDVVLDPTMGSEARLDALRQLRAQMLHGIAALHLSRAPGDPLSSGAATGLANLSQVLGR